MQAKTRFAQAADSHISSAVGLIGLGSLEASQGSWPKAAEYFESALEVLATDEQRYSLASSDIDATLLTR